MCIRLTVYLSALLATVFLVACDSGSGGVQVFREPAQNIPPTAIFSVSVTEGKAPLSDVQFDATESFDTNGSIEDFAWDFGDGTPIISGVDETTPVHSYMDEGSFVVILTVTDNDNATNTDLVSRTITVFPNQPPVASFTWSVGSDGLTASLDAGSSSDSDGSITNYVWDFGDPNAECDMEPCIGPFVTYVFTTAGEYPVSLTVTDDNGDVDEITLDVTAPGPNLPPTARVSTMPAADSASRIVVGFFNPSQTVMFNAGGSDDSDGDLIQYDWDFGDAQFGTARVEPDTDPVEFVEGSVTGVGDMGTGITAYHVYSTLSSSQSARSVPGSLTRSLAVGDIDKKMGIDFVAGNFGEPNHLFLNNGSDTTPFDDVRSIDIANEVGATNAVILVDLDSDGYLDLIVANGVIGDPADPVCCKNRVYLWNSVVGAYAGGVDLSSSHMDVSTSLAIGLINDDLDLDIVVGNLNAPARVYLGNGVGGFEPGMDVSAETLDVTSVALEDMDGDGDLDLVVGTSSGTNRYYPGKDDGTFFPGFDISSDIFNTVSVAIGDVDRDGNPDLVTGNLGSISGEPNRLYLNDCENPCAANSNVFAEAVDSDRNSDITEDRERTSVVMLADVDGDGDQDLLVGNIGGSSRLYLNHSKLRSDLLFNATLAAVGDDIDCSEEPTPDECIEVPVTSGDEYSTEEVGSLHLVSFNSDVKVDPDLLIGTLGNPTKLLTNFCSPDCMADANPYSRASVVDIPSNNTTSVAIGDVNNDGTLDLVAGHFGSVNRLHLSSDGVSFALGSDIGANIESTQAVILGDVDNDGDLDLMVGNAGDGNKLYLNICDGLCSFDDDVFGAALNISLDLTNTADLALGDVDQDGDLDLVTGNGIFGAQPNRVYFNSCDSGCNANENVFPELVNGMANGVNISSLIANTNSIALGDLDGDGDLDLVVGNDTALSRIFANNCNGPCNPANTIDFSVVSSVSLNVGSVRSVVLGDLNNDGRLDLVVGYGDQVDLVFINTTVSSALITFAPGDEFGVDVNEDGILDVDVTSDIGLADINGDGYLDIITAVDGVSRLYLNNGAGQFDNGVDRVDANTVVTGESSSVRAIATANVDDPMIDRDVDVVFGVVGAPNRLHLNDGAHIALLTVTDDDDESDTTAVTIVVQNNQPPRAEFSADTSGGLTVEFDGTASDDLDPISVMHMNSGIEMFMWDFGDGNSGTGPSVVHVYDDERQYTVRLTVVDEVGAKGNASMVIDVVVP